MPACRFPALLRGTAGSSRPSPTTLLEELRILTSFDVDSKDELTLVLAGHPQLESNLRLAVNEALSQRVMLKVRLASLSRDAVERYLAHRLERARAGRARPHAAARPRARSACSQRGQSACRSPDSVRHSVRLALTLTPQAQSGVLTPVRLGSLPRLRPHADAPSRHSAP